MTPLNTCPLLLPRLTASVTYKIYPHVPDNTAVVSLVVVIRAQFKPS